MYWKALLILYVVDFSWSRCDCGRGGLCLDHEGGKLQNVSPNKCYCDVVSKRIFEPALKLCDTMVSNYCDQKPCTQGDCYNGFGTFICKCGSAQGVYTGHTCSEPTSSFSLYSLFVTLWYPVTEQKRWVAVLSAYKMSDGITFIFEFEHERTWIAHAHNCRAVSNEIVMNRCEENGGGPDCAILKFTLANSKVSIECDVPLTFSWSRAVQVDGVLGPVGYYHDVKFKAVDETLVHLSATYRVFLETGQMMRRCPYTVRISGCGDSPKTATQAISSVLLTLSASFEFSNVTNVCNVQSKVYKWFLAHLRHIGDPLEVGTEQSIDVIPSNHKFTGGMVTITVEMTFKGVITNSVALEDETIVVMCYVKLIQRTFYVEVNEVFLRYTCRVKANIKIIPTLYDLQYPEEELSFNWICPEEICQGANLSHNILTAEAIGQCGDSYPIALEVKHLESNTMVSWEGKILFTTPDEYSIDLYFNPESAEVNPTLPLTITASDALKLAENYTWYPNFLNETKCGTGVPSNIYMIPANTLEWGQIYSFKVQNEKGSKYFSIYTATGPHNLICSVHPDSPLKPHLDKYNVNCTALATKTPLTYYVYEGEAQELVMISPNPHMENISFSNVPIRIEIENSYGMRIFTYANVTVAELDKEHYVELLNSIPQRIQHVYSLIRDGEFEGVVDEVDQITKLIEHGFPFTLQHTLMDILSHIKTCLQEECVVKTIQSIRRLIAINSEDSLQSGVDDFILLGGGAIYTMTQSLKQIGSKMRQYAAYSTTRILNEIHHAARDLINFVDPLLQHPTIDEDIRRIHYRKVEQGNAFARQALAELGLFITSHIPHPAFPYELTYNSTGEVTRVISHLPEHINCLEQVNGLDSHIHFTPSAIQQLSRSGSILSVAIIQYKTTDFWWSEKANASTAEPIEVHVYAKSPDAREWGYMDNTMFGPVQTIGNITQWKTKGQEGDVDVPKRGVITPEEMDPYVSVHRTIVPRGHGSLILSFPQSVVGYIRVVYSKSIYPSYQLTEKYPILNQTLLAVKYYSEEPTTHIYLGIVANLGRIKYVFNVSLVQCVTWSERMWKSESCIVTDTRLNGMIECSCQHLSLFTTRISTPQSDQISMLQLSLSTTVNDAWYAIPMILAILITLTSLHFITSRMEWSERHKGYISFLDDNWPGEDYLYLIAVYSGGRCMSGTDSNVAIRLLGDQSMSRVHILTSDKSRSIPLSWGQDCWFFLFTTSSLGKIQYIELWHDGIGCNSEWYCMEVIIWDIETEERFHIPITTWLTFTGLYHRNDTTFRFRVNTMSVKKTWTSRVSSHFHAKFRQEHHWVSVVLLHPRSQYTRLDRLVIVTVVVMVTVATTMLFYLDNLGPADRSKFNMTVADVYVAFEAAVISSLVVIVPALLFSIGRNERIRVSSDTKSPKELFQRLFTHPVTHRPILTEQGFVTQQRKRNYFIVGAYCISLAITISSVTLIVKSALNFGQYRSVVWFIVSVGAICFEAVIINPIMLLTSAILLAHVTKRTARDNDIIIIKFGEDFPGAVNESRRLDRMLHYRVKSMYKPPFTWKVKERATKDSRRDRFDVYLFSVVLVSLLLIPSLVYLLKKELRYHKHFQLTELIRDQTSPEDGLASVRNRTRYFNYLRGPILQALHRYSWYNGKQHYPEWRDAFLANDTWAPSTTFIGFCSDYTTKLVGVPQFRQQRIMPDSKRTLAPEFQRHFQNAYGQFERSTEDQKTYLPNWETPRSEETYYTTYQYHRPDRKAMTFYGVSRRAYDSGGYVEYLHWSLGVSQSRLVDLELDNWIDNLTRTIFFTFNLYNVFDEKISYVTIITECLPSGVYQSRTMTESASVSSDFLLHEKIVAFIVLGIAAVVVHHIVRTAAIVSKQGFVKYLKSVSGLIDLLFIFAGIGLVVATINRYFHFFAAIQEIESDEKDTYKSLHSRFNQNYIALIFVGIFSWSATVLGSISVYKVVGFEAVNLRGVRAQALLFTFCGINIFAAYVSQSLSYFGSGVAPSLIFLLFFKEPAASQYTFALVSVSTPVFMIAIIAFLVLIRLNLVILVNFYTETACLIVPKTPVFHQSLSTLRSRLHIIESLRPEDYQTLLLRLEGKKRVRFNLARWSKDGSGQSPNMSSSHDLKSSIVHESTT